MEQIDYLVVHCSDTPNGRETHAQDIHRWHLEQGWDGIGYHAVITLKGEVQWGRPRYWQGAHADPFNARSLGICLIGRDEFTNAQMRALEGLLLSLKLDYPKANVVGHRDLNSHKACPNFDVKTWWLGVEQKGID